MTKHEIEYNNDPKHCPICKTIIEWNKRFNKFCSRSCSATNSNFVSQKRLPTHLKECANCKNITNNPKFCSEECSNIFKKSSTKTQLQEYITSNGEFPTTGANHESDRKKIKQYLISITGHKCSICENTEWQNKPIPLIVDHIDGNTDNHSVENFRLVCGNCDMQLDTYKSKNRNSKRQWRKKYTDK